MFTAYRACAVLLTLPMAAGLAGCAKAQARTEPTRPALEVPAPPPREIAPVDTVEVRSEVPELPVTDEAPAPAPRPTRATRETAPKPETATAKAEPEPRTPTKPPAAALRRPQTASDSQVERKIREALTRASRNLDTLNYGALNTDAKSQYDTAKRFMKQAEEGLQAKNYVFAATLADKADTIAAALLGR